MTLTELFDNHQLARLRNHDRSQRTIYEYRQSLKYWEAATGGVAVGKVKEKHIVAFKDYLKSLPGKKPGSTMAANTIRKHLRMIRPLLALAAPKDMSNKRGLGIMTEMPELAPPAEELREAADTFTREEIVAWINAAKSRRARPIAGVPSPLWWECLLKLIYNTGIRIGTAIQIRWDWIDFDDRTICIEKEAGVKTTYTVSLNDEAVEVLEAIRQTSNRTESHDRVFCWEMDYRTLYRHASSQMKLAGFPEKRRFKFHAIRKYFGSEIAAESLAAATQALGHSTPIVTTRYYVNRKQVSAPVINRIQPIGRAIVPVAPVPPANVPAVLPDAPINHVESAADLFGGVMFVFR